MKYMLIVYSFATTLAAAAPAPSKVDCTRNYLAVDGSKHTILLERTVPGQNVWRVTASFVTGGLRPRPSPIPEQGQTVLAEGLECDFTSVSPLQVKCQDRAASPNAVLTTSLGQTQLGKFIRLTVSSPAVSQLIQNGELRYYGLVALPGTEQAMILFSAQPGRPGSATLNRCVVN